MKAPEEARDLTGLLFRLRARGYGVRASCCRTTRLVKPCRACSPAQEHVKEHALVAGQGIEGSDRPAVLGRCVGRQRLEIPHGGSGILHLAQGLQEPDIALGRGLFDIGTTMSRFFVGEPMPLRHGPGGVLEGSTRNSSGLLITVSERK